MDTKKLNSAEWVQYLEDVRKLHRWDWTDLANVAGVSRSSVYYWTKGQKVPHASMQTLVRMKLDAAPVNVAYKTRAEVKKEVAAFAKKWQK